MSHPNPANNQNGDDGSTFWAKTLFGWTSAKWTPFVFFLLMGVLSAGLLIADFLIERHAYDAVKFSEFPMFYGLYGFAAFSFVVVCGWPLGALLRRSEDYYGDEVEPAGDQTGGEAD